ncbi:Hint domain-containing protein, partial [Klebsiella pneumoniae]|uniref:Hint domain-containing protein n=1 Tax=Klebsiella pneumoniae TaxID=573 RepID=UPI003013F506
FTQTNSPTSKIKSGFLTVSDGGTDLIMNNLTLQTGFSGKFVVTGDQIIAVCYARGSMIRTPDGKQPVEKLRPGRQVITLVDGQPVAQTVKW